MAVSSCTPKRESSVSHVPRGPLQPSAREIHQNRPIREAGFQLGVVNLNSRFTGTSESSIFESGFYNNNRHASTGIYFRHGIADRFGMQSRLAVNFGFNYSNFSGNWGSPDPFFYVSDTWTEFANFLGYEDNFFGEPDVETIELTETDNISKFENNVFSISAKPEFYIINKRSFPLRIYAFTGLNLMFINPELFNSANNIIPASEIDETIKPSSIVGIGFPLGFGLTHNIDNRFFIGYEMEYLFGTSNHSSGVYDRKHNDSYLSNRIKIGFRIK